MLHSVPGLTKKIKGMHKYIICDFIVTVVSLEFVYRCLNLILEN